MPKKFFVLVFLFGLLVLLSVSNAFADAPTDSHQFYVVAYGDSLDSIAAQFDVPVATIRAVNGMNARFEIYVGQSLRIPVYAGAPAAAPTYFSYVVQYGDTLFSIARRYGVSVATLTRVNRIFNPNFIFAGMRLIIPRAIYPPPAYGTYIVRFGDTLFGIALRFRTSIYALMIANNIPNPNLIFAGMRLIIPSATRSPYGTRPSLPGYPTARPTTTGPTPTPVTGTTNVSLRNIAFNPRTLSIRVGTRVNWTNIDAVQHTVTSGAVGAPSGLFDSPTLSAGQNFGFTFTATGTIAYFCRIHGAAMTGTITVTP
ncbi:MAG: LysM peptidoglycan-binding domain-containing protein [Chloroflexi bacterium]|nr:LysM peptidoglycan-binding domain-containing protein [Chloroflexota bacterium]